MRILAIGALLLGVAALAVASNGLSLWNIDDARLCAETPGKGIEMKVALDGSYEEIEFHYPLSKLGRVPPFVRDRMDQLFPAGTVAGIEREYHPTGAFWELTKVVNQKKHEVMFDQGGEPVSFEIEMDEKDVPAAAVNGLNAAYPTAAGFKWEKIVVGADPGGPVSEYHAKFKIGNRNFKVVVTPTGHVPGAYLEVPAEIEVPIPVGQTN